MEEKELQEQPVEVKEESEKCAKEPKSAKKFSGDTRTFVISLLTAVIVVLIYHGIIVGIRCMNNSGCRRENPTERCTPPPPPRPQHHHPREQGEHQQHQRRQRPPRHDGQRDGQRGQRRQRPPRHDGQPRPADNAPTSQDQEN